MPETPEVPDANDPFSKKVAITIALLAVGLAVIDSKGDNAKTDAILKTNEAANKWGHYQAKSLKQNLSETEARLLSLLPSPAETAARKEAIANAKTEAARYGSDKEAIKVEAEKLVATAEHNSKINDRCDLAALGMQIAVVVCSVAILSHWRLFWFIGMALGGLGLAVGVSAYLM